MYLRKRVRGPSNTALSGKAPGARMRTRRHLPTTVAPRGRLVRFNASLGGLGASATLHSPAAIRPFVPPRP